jgi:hypothetical protein
MVAEERITTKFSGLVGAYGSEEEATFLATQQVDEARHMQFYARFQDEVIADPTAIADHVARSRERLSPAFAKIFDEALVQAHERLVRNPADPRAKVAFVTTYHLVIEATLGLTAFEFITRYLEREELLPGFVVGYTKIHHDEHRHIGYGTWYLQTAVAADIHFGQNGADTLAGLGGNDLLCGGNGADHLSGGEGDDTLDAAAPTGSAGARAPTASSAGSARIGRVTSTRPKATAGTGRSRNTAAAWRERCVFPQTRCEKAVIGVFAG